MAEQEDEKSVDEIIESIKGGEFPKVREVFSIDNDNDRRKIADELIEYAKNNPEVILREINKDEGATSQQKKFVLAITFSIASIEDDQTKSTMFSRIAGTKLNEFSEFEEFILKKWKVNIGKINTRPNRIIFGSFKDESLKKIWAEAFDITNEELVEGSEFFMSMKRQFKQSKQNPQNDNDGQSVSGADGESVDDELEEGLPDEDLDLAEDILDEESHGTTTDIDDFDAKIEQKKAELDALKKQRNDTNKASIENEAKAEIEGMAPEELEEAIAQKQAEIEQLKESLKHLAKGLLKRLQDELGEEHKDIKGYQNFDFDSMTYKALRIQVGAMADIEETHQKKYLAEALLIKEKLAKLRGHYDKDRARYDEKLGFPHSDEPLEDDSDEIKAEEGEEQEVDFTSMSILELKDYINQAEQEINKIKSSYRVLAEDTRSNLMEFFTNNEQELWNKISFSEDVKMKDLRARLGELYELADGYRKEKRKEAKSTQKKFDKYNQAYREDFAEFTRRKSQLEDDELVQNENDAAEPNGQENINFKSMSISELQNYIDSMEEPITDLEWVIYPELYNEARERLRGMVDEDFDMSAFDYIDFDEYQSVGLDNLRIFLHRIFDEEDRLQRNGRAEKYVQMARESGKKRRQLKQARKRARIANDERPSGVLEDNQQE